MNNLKFGPLIAEGKTKRIYAHTSDNGLVYMVNKDCITAGDGTRWNSFVGKSRWSTITAANILTAGFSRVKVHADTRTLNNLRNRIAHYEPIYHRQLNLELDSLLVITRWICPDAADWIYGQAAAFQRTWNKTPSEWRPLMCLLTQSAGPESIGM
jgi:SAICAR synthetase